MLLNYVLAAFMLCCVLLLYVTNRHQILLANPISKRFRPLAYAGLALSLICWLLLLSFASALLMWFMVLMIGLMLMPMVSLKQER
ncbi:hypothetical protein K0504_06215 [Neiella marina]|uniref:Uncharacterized protein n=1 Tax=Neiella holothuriorum TaxID=2870530 RepID=A0ABS7EG02_9GAMM|nr:hypothetical protein [Neiella holothuriorum]MBW8190627.1 hypothetical protein [Neiella holothuriorum]